jgi:hypothetical protein
LFGMPLCKDQARINLQALPPLKTPYQLKKFKLIRSFFAESAFDKKKKKLLL